MDMTGLLRNVVLVSVAVCAGGLLAAQASAAPSRPPFVVKAKSPPGALRFATKEVDTQMQVFPGAVAKIYPATLPGGRKGHLIVVRLVHNGPTAYAQPDCKRFKLRQGERVIVVISRRSWGRVLPYNGAKLDKTQDP